MFAKQNVYVMVNGFKVRVKDAREKDRNHLVEIDFEAPLTHELADDIMPKMATDLFDSVNGEWVPKAELLDVSFDLTPDPQILSGREHPELDPFIKIPGVSIRKVSAYKGDGSALLLGFTATWTLADPKEAIVMIQRLKQGIFVTCEAQQRTLAEADQAADDKATENQGTLADVDKGGNVTQMRKRGATVRGRKTDKAEAPASEAAGG